MEYPKPFLYVKAGCPWCMEVEAWLQDHHIAYDKVVVSGNAAAFAEMQQISGQSKAPTMKWGSELLADFGAQELEAFMRQRGVVK